MCVLRRKEEGVFFLPSFFLPLSMSVLYPTPLFSIFTCSSRCEGSEILNYRNGLVSALWLYQKQPSLCSLLTWHTLSHTLIITVQTVYKHTLQVKEAKHTNAWYLQLYWYLFQWFACDLDICFQFQVHTVHTASESSSKHHSWMFLQKCLDVQSL